MSARPGFSLCVCPDGQLIREHVNELLLVHAVSKAGTARSGSARSGDASGWERHVFWGDEELPPRFWEHLTLQGLFEVPRALVVRNAHNLPADIWKRLSKALGRPSEQAWPVFCLEVAWEKGQPKIPAHISKLACFAFAEKQQWIWRSAGLDARSLRHHVQTRVKSQGLTIAPDALEALCATLPLQAATVEGEVDKLALLVHSQGRQSITKTDTNLATFTPEFNIFAFLKDMQSGHSTSVWTAILREQAKGEERIFYLSTMLLREARQLWQIMAREQVYVRPQELAAKRQLAARLGPSGLARLWDMAHTADLAVKSGRYSPDQALDVLVADLTLLFAPAIKR